MNGRAAEAQSFAGLMIWVADSIAIMRMRRRRRRGFIMRPANAIMRPANESDAE